MKRISLHFVAGIFICAIGLGLVVGVRAAKMRCRVKRAMHMLQEGIASCKRSHCDPSYLIGEQACLQALTNMNYKQLNAPVPVSAVLYENWPAISQSWFSAKCLLLVHWLEWQPTVTGVCISNGESSLVLSIHEEDIANNSERMKSGDLSYCACWGWDGVESIPSCLYDAASKMYLQYNGYGKKSNSTGGIPIRIIDDNINSPQKATDGPQNMAK